jgi:hypothetical protein
MVALIVVIGGSLWFEVIYAGFEIFFSEENQGLMLGMQAYSHITILVTTTNRRQQRWFGNRSMTHYRTCGYPHCWRPFRW